MWRIFNCNTQSLFLYAFSQCGAKLRWSWRCLSRTRMRTMPWGMLLWRNKKIKSPFHEAAWEDGNPAEYLTRVSLWIYIVYVSVCESPLSNYALFYWDHHVHIWNTMYSIPNKRWFTTCAIIIWTYLTGNTHKDTLITLQLNPNTPLWTWDPKPCRHQLCVSDINSEKTWNWRATDLLIGLKAIIIKLIHYFYSLYIYIFFVTRRGSILFMVNTKNVFISFSF